MTTVKTTSTIAPLKNVAALNTLVEEVKSRQAGLPGFGVFSGFPGYGKSWAAGYAHNAHHGSVYLEIKSMWTKKDFLKALLSELGEPANKGTHTELFDRIVEVIGDDADQVIIIDEADRLIDRKLIEIVRDIHDAAQNPIILVGEESLPNKLRVPELDRFHRRVLRWRLAQPCDHDDARVLADKLIPETHITDELLAHIIERTEGNAGRIATTLYAVGDEAAISSADVMDLSTYRGPIHTGEHQRRFARRSAAA